MEVYYLNKTGEKIILKTDLQDLPRNRCIWIRLLNPGEDNINKISKFSGIPPEEFTEFIEEEERSRVDYKGYLQIIYQTPVTQREEVTTDSLSMFVQNNIIVTTERENVPVLDSISRLLRIHKLKFLLRGGPGKFVNQVLDRTNEEFLKAIEKISRVVRMSKTEDIEVQQKMLVQLYNSNVTLTHFNQAIVANLEIINNLRKNRYKHFTDNDRDEFTELYYDVLQLLDTEKIQREIITSQFNFQTVWSSFKLNSFMKKLTSLALIIMVPTFIASVYGMNVNLPFGRHSQGFWLVGLFMLLITLGIYMWFKRIDWV